MPFHKYTNSFPKGIFIKIHLAQHFWQLAIWHRGAYQKDVFTNVPAVFGMKNPEIWKWGLTDVQTCKHTHKYIHTMSSINQNYKERWYCKAVRSLRWAEPLPISHCKSSQPFAIAFPYLVLPGMHQEAGRKWLKIIINWWIASKNLPAVC